MGEFSLTHWLIVCAILMIFFGPSRLPGLGKSIGEAIKGFKEGINTDEEKTAKQSPPPQQVQNSTSTAASAARVANPEKKQV